MYITLMYICVCVDICTHTYIYVRTHMYMYVSVCGFRFWLIGFDGIVGGGEDGGAAKEWAVGEFDRVLLWRGGEVACGWVHA